MSIQAQEGHEHSTSFLLRRNADITVVDELGRTPVDLAQNRWIQTALRQAWNDATRQKADAGYVAASNPAVTGNKPSPESSPRSVTDSPEPLKYSASRVRSGRLLKPFQRQSRSLDQPEYGDMNRSPSTHCRRVSALYNSLLAYSRVLCFCAFLCKVTYCCCWPAATTIVLFFSAFEYWYLQGSVATQHCWGWWDLQWSLYCKRTAYCFSKRQRLF